jgi:hypothetical protein
MTKPGYRRPITLRRLAIIRELADLGCSITEAAILCGVEPACISQYGRRFGVVMRDGRRSDPWLRRRVLRDFGKGMTYAEMAERYGTTKNAIGVTVHKLRQDGLLLPPSWKSAMINTRLEANP